MKLQSCTANHQKIVFLEKRVEEVSLLLSPIKEHFYVQKGKRVFTFYKT